MIYFVLLNFYVEDNLSQQIGIKAMASTKFDVEKFIGKNNFNLWWVKMPALLT